MLEMMADTGLSFQSAPLREGRRAVSTWTELSESFNPRPCVRGDGRDRVGVVAMP